MPDIGTPSLDQLRVFLTVVETGSFAADVARLNRRPAAAHPPLAIRSPISRCSSASHCSIANARESRFSPKLAQPYAERLDVQAQGDGRKLRFECPHGIDQP